MFIAAFMFLVILTNIMQRFSQKEEDKTYMSSSVENAYLGAAFGRFEKQGKFW